MISRFIQNQLKNSCHLETKVKTSNAELKSRGVKRVKQKIKLSLRSKETSEQHLAVVKESRKIQTEYICVTYTWAKYNQKVTYPALKLHAPILYKMLPMKEQTW